MWWDALRVCKERQYDAVTVIMERGQPGRPVPVKVRVFPMEASQFDTAAVSLDFKSGSSQP